MMTSNTPRSGLRRTVLLTLAALVLVAVSTRPTSAQGGFAVAPRLGIDAGIAGTPVTAGLDVTWYEPPLPWIAIRSRVDIGITTADLEEEAGEPHEFRAVTAETEIVVGPTHTGETELKGMVNPVVFGGVGIRTARDTAYDSKLSPIATYGGQVRYWLSDRLRVGAELRLRTPLFGDGKLAPDFDGGVSFALSAAIRFGGAGDGAAPATRPEPPRRQTAARPARSEPVTQAAEASGEMAVGVLKPEPKRPDPVELRYVPRTDLSDRARRTWSPPEDRTVAETLASAEQFLGTPYVWGGATPEPGFDCSGFIQYVYEDMGIALPRPSRRMALAGMELPPVVDSLRPGDLMFFAEDGDRITHVAIYVGDNEILHASSSGVGVAYDKLGTYRGSWYLQHFVGGSRVIGVPIRALRSRPIPITPETWDPPMDGAPPPGAGPGGP